MFIKEHKAALLSFDVDIEPYMVDGVVADNEGALSVMLPLTRHMIAIKFAEDDPDVETMVAHAFTMLERFCSVDQAYAFYNDTIASPKRYDRIIQFFTILYG